MSRYIENKKSFKTFRVTVATAGTPVQLRDMNIPDGYKLIIKALDANTGVMLTGETSDAAKTGFELGAGQSIGYNLQNSNMVWVDASVSGEIVCCSVEQN